ncbi:tetratricopeptide repeat protein [Mycolicibacterium vaccae]|uniref:tetratricopeptide repeat protein n=1 Tax=Mycolicibacterium vaccae TaxID=1810 RepID=UPI003CE7FE6E
MAIFVHGAIRWRGYDFRVMSEPIQQTLAAQASLRSRDYQGAASAAWAALSTDPNNEHAMRLYTLALNGQGRTAEALSMAWQTAGAHPQSPLAQYTYASLLLEAGKPQHALTVVNEALRLDPSATDSVVLLGDIQRSMGNRGAAEAAYQAALRLEPTHAVAVQNIGLAVTRVMRMTTAGVVLLAVALIVVSAAHDESIPTAVPRIAAAALCVPLTLGIAWVVRTVPRPTLRAVLRRRVLLGVRIGFVALAILAGLIAAVFGPSVVVTAAGPLLLLGVVTLTVIGWVTDA